MSDPYTMPAPVTATQIDEWLPDARWIFATATVYHASYRCALASARRGGWHPFLLVDTLQAFYRPCKRCCR